MNKQPFSPLPKQELLVIMEKTKESCTKAAQNGFQDALISGLCADGAAEAAISAIQNLDLEKLLDEIQ